MHSGGGRGRGAQRGASTNASSRRNGDPPSGPRSRRQGGPATALPRSEERSARQNQAPRQRARGGFNALAAATSGPRNQNRNGQQRDRSSNSPAVADSQDDTSFSDVEASDGGSSEQDEQPVARQRQQMDFSGDATSDTERELLAEVAQKMPDINRRYERLKKGRRALRDEYIKKGLMQHPDEQRNLALAITMVGECQDMCPEYERVTRIVERDVWPHENVPESLEYGRRARLFDEGRMIKKFRRSAAGLEEQLPCDLRPPKVLKATASYMWGELLPKFSFIEVQTFIWDRTRGIRNDFSIQQVTKLEDVKLAINTFEEIVRFHLLSLHTMSSAAGKDVLDYNWSQDHEQLGKTLVSLEAYYYDNRDKYQSPHEAEIRSYQILLCLYKPIADIDAQISHWPSHIIADPRVRRAVALYNTGVKPEKEEVGPIKPFRKRVFDPIDWLNFWEEIQDNQYSFLMVATAEISFMRIRDTIMKSLYKSYRQGGRTRSEEWTLEEMGKVLGFAREEETRKFCSTYGFKVAKTTDGTSEYVDLASVQARVLKTPSDKLPNQMASIAASNKMFGRKPTAIITGISVLEARRSGLVELEDDATQDAMEESVDDGKSLFVGADESDESETEQPHPAAQNTGLFPNARDVVTKLRSPSPVSAAAQNTGLFPMAKDVVAKMRSTSPMPQQQTPAEIQPASNPSEPAPPPKAPQLGAPSQSPFAGSNSQRSFQPFSNQSPFSTPLQTQTPAVAQPVAPPPVAAPPQTESVLNAPSNPPSASSNSTWPTPLSSIQSAFSAPLQAQTPAVAQPVAPPPVAARPQTESVLNAPSNSTFPNLGSPSIVQPSANQSAFSRPAETQTPAAVQPVVPPSSAALTENEPVLNAERERALDIFAEQLVVDKSNGVMKQFLEHLLPGIIVEEMKSFEAAKALEEATQFRQMKLAKKYFSLWWEIQYKKKLIRRGAKRRAKIQAAAMSTQAPPVSNGILASISSNSAMPPPRSRPSKRDGNASQGNTRSGSKNGVSNANGSNTNGHPTCPDCTCAKCAAAQDMSRSNSGITTDSFRAFNMAEAELRKDMQLDATESDYFLRKTLGLLKQNPTTRKRSRNNEDAADTPVGGKWTSRSKRLQSNRLPKHSPTPEFAGSDDEADHVKPQTDEERFARITALKERLRRPYKFPSLEVKAPPRRQYAPEDIIAAAVKDPIAANVASIYNELDETEQFYHEAIADLRRSRSGSNNKTTSPLDRKKNTTQKSPVLNGVQKSTKKTTSNTSPPKPAFYGRVSRFVPRELYGKGVDALRASGYGKVDKGKGRMRDPPPQPPPTSHYAPPLPPQPTQYERQPLYQQERQQVYFDDTEEGTEESGSRRYDDDSRSPEEYDEDYDMGGHPQRYDEEQEYEEYGEDLEGRGEDELMDYDDEEEDEGYGRGRPSQSMSGSAYGRPSQSASGSAFGGKGGTSKDDAIEL